MKKISHRPARVCILTGGGDAPGLNAVLRAFVKTCAAYDIETLGSEDGFEGLIHPGRLVRLKVSSVQGILPRGGSILGCSNTANPTSYPVRSPSGKVELVDMTERVLETLHEHRIEVLVLVGGDGTMTHGKMLMERGIDVIGISKTIDNDLPQTDRTFGFDTAVNTATWAIDTLHSTAEAHDRVMIVELMGRYAGWISLHAGIAGGADVILIPEIPYDIDRVIDKIRERSARGAKFSIVVVGEGARPKDGHVSELTPGMKGHLPRLGGAGQRLADMLSGRIEHEVRVTVVGHLQRGGSPSALDRVLGTQFGVRAADMCLARESGAVIVFKDGKVTSIPLDSVGGRTKVIAADDELLHTARCIGIELGH